MKVTITEIHISCVHKMCSFFDVRPLMPKARKLRTMKAASAQR